MDGGDWEWFHTTTAPDEHPSHERVLAIDDVARADEVRAFLEAHSPTADTEPGQGERWFAIEDPDGSLARRRRLGHHPRRRAAPVVGRRRHPAARAGARPHDRRRRHPPGRRRDGRLHPRDVLAQRGRPRALPRRSATTGSAPGRAARSSSTADRRRRLRPQAKSAATTFRSASCTRTTQLPELSRHTASVP